MDIGPIILDLQGTELSSEEQELLKNPLVGGVILFSRNFIDINQLVKLTKHIRSIRTNALIFVDQEGGRVQRFKSGFTLLPSLRGLGTIYDSSPENQALALDLSTNLGALMAMEILATGVDLSLAPVVDLDKELSEVIGNRAFHSKAEATIKLARSFVRGMALAGMPATLKHFPGHGSVILDSHLALPHDERTKAEISQDIKPFEALAHDPNVKAVMPAHIVYDEFDSLPACFSSYWLKEVLREKLGFTGAIISDDLSMEGAVSMGSYPQRVQAALRAGCDLVLVCNNRAGLVDILSTNIELGSDASIKRRGDLKGAYHYDFDTLKLQKLWLDALSKHNLFAQTLSDIENSLVLMR